MDAIDGEQVAAVLEPAAVLVVRHLTYGHSLSSAVVLAKLDDDGPARISELAAASGINQSSMTELIERLTRPPDQSTEDHYPTQPSSLSCGPLGSDASRKMSCDCDLPGGYAQF